MRGKGRVRKKEVGGRVERRGKGGISIVEMSERCDEGEGRGGRGRWERGDVSTVEGSEREADGRR